MSIATGRLARNFPRFAVPLSLRFALRELRGGLAGFAVFLGCIVLGTSTIAAVTSLAAGLGESIAREGRTIAGGDITFSLTHRTATPEEASFLADAGRVSTVATLRGMLRTASASPLVELKAVDGAYPLVGAVRLRSGRKLRDVLAEDGPTPVVVDENLLASGFAVGDEAKLGRATVRISDVIDGEPDRLSGGIGFGPRVMLTVDALADAGLTTPGSLVRWQYRLTGGDAPLPQSRIDEIVSEAKATFPTAGWRIETRADAAPSLKSSIERFAQFLTMVGLTALAVGGVGVANAVRSHIVRRRRSIAMLRVLGASRRFVTAVYLQQIMLLALIGVAAGIAIGAAVPLVAATMLEGRVPVSALGRLFPSALGLAAVYGLLTAFTFAILPLARAGSVRPIALLRADDETGGDRRFVVAAGASGLALAAVAIVGGYDRWIAGACVAGIAALFVALRGLGILVTFAARWAPRSRRAVVRLAVGNLHRRGALTPTVTLSLGLSLTLLAALSLVDGNLRNALSSRLPSEAPSFFFIDIQNAEKEAFVASLKEMAPDGVVEAQPMLRGRIVAINGVRAEKWPETEASWVLRGDRGITYSAAPPSGSRVLEGAWWPADGPAANEVSFDAELAGELGLRVGDTLRVNVLGREVEAKVSNLRSVDWETLGINFVMVFSPNVFAGAPHAHLATLSLPDDDTPVREAEILKSISESFPTVTSIRVKDALAMVNDVVADLMFAIRVAASVTLVASMLVLAGTLAASHQNRIYDAVILKVLGARRLTIVGVYALEYALLGLACAVFALAGGALAAWVVIDPLMDLDFEFLPGTALTTVVAGVTLTVGLGLVGTWRVLGAKPAKVLRQL